MRGSAGNSILYFQNNINKLVSKRAMNLPPFSWLVTSHLTNLFPPILAIKYSGWTTILEELLKYVQNDKLNCRKKQP